MHRRLHRSFGLGSAILNTGIEFQALQAIQRRATLRLNLPLGTRTVDPEPHPFPDRSHAHPLSARFWINVIPRQSPSIGPARRGRGAEAASSRTAASMWALVSGCTTMSWLSVWCTALVAAR
jgi:hypothetical protein